MRQQPGQGDPGNGDAALNRHGPHGFNTAEGPLPVDHREIKLTAPAVFGRLSLRAEFPGKQTARQGAPDHKSQALVPDKGQHFPLQVTAGDGVIGLDTGKARPAPSFGNGQPLHDLPGRQVAQADVAHLAGANQIVQGLKCFLKRGERVEAVQLVEVDMVQL